MENEQQDHEERIPAPRANQLARRDFSGTSLAVGNAATAALEAKARADIEARWVMALRRPRNLDDVRQDILDECRRPGFAAVAVYKVPRGQTTIEGLSIRFAEVAVRCMGNMQPDAVTIYDDATSRIVRVTVTDFETNVTWSKDLTIKKTVERKFLKKGQKSYGERENSFGDRVYIVEATDDDIATKEAALISKASRTLILRSIPGHIQDEALKICKAIQRDKDAKDPDAARVAMLDSFAAQGVKASEIEEYLGHTTERMSPHEIGDLRNLFVAIRDGEISWSAALAEAEAARTKPAGTTNAPAAGTAPATQPAAQSAAQSAPAPVTTSTAKPAGTRGKATAALKEQIAKPATDTAFDKAAAEVRAKESAKVEPAPKAELPPDEPPPRDGYRDEPCSSCGSIMEVPVTDAPGGRCYACANA